MRYPRKNFVYLSNIINLPLIDSVTGKRLGYTRDLTASLGAAYPKISGIVASRKFSRRTFFLPWSAVVEYDENVSITVDGEKKAAGEGGTQMASEILLRGTFWDKQIVDMSGAKVVRVNDLHIIREDLNLWLVHIDIGFKGFLRRLGWLRFVNFLVQWLFSYALKDKFIPWKYVQPLATTNVYGSLSLTIPYAKFAEMHPADLADVLIDLGTEERFMIFRALDRNAAAETLEELPVKIQKQLVHELPDEQLAEILNEMAMDEVVDLIDELPRERVHALFELFPQEKVQEIKSLLRHSEHSAGAFMNTEFITVREDMPLSTVLKKIKKEHTRAESFYYIYVENEDEELVGITTLRQLLITDPSTPISEIMHRNIIKVDIATDIKVVAGIFIKYDFVVVPVVDEQKKIVGIITIKDALEAVFPEIRSEAEEA